VGPKKLPEMQKDKKSRKGTLNTCVLRIEVQLLITRFDLLISEESFFFK